MKPYHWLWIVVAVLLIFWLLNQLGWLSVAIN